MDTFKVIVMKEEFICRYLTRKEYRDITRKANEDTLIFEELICAACVISPGNYKWDSCLAGVPYLVSKAILEECGYIESERQPLRDFESEAVEWISTPEGRINAMICFCFPGQTPDTLENMSPKEWAQFSAMAHLIVASMYGIDPTAFVEGKPPKQRDPAETTTPVSFLQPRQVGNRQSQIDVEGNYIFSK